MRHTNPTSLILLLLTLMGYSAAAMAEPEVNALPTNGQVQAGDITIEQNITEDQAVMNINQATERGIIHWDTFNVGEKSTVNFNQPTTKSVTLNRITTANPSQIYGQINANGEVILENSSGIYFSPSASIEVGGITATTGHISDEDFNNDERRFAETNDTAVVNAGRIHALESHIALLAPEVRNEGMIIASKGDVALASGAEIHLQFNDNNRLVKVNTTPSLYNSLIENKLVVEAPGGSIIISATALNQINGGLIKQAGTINVGSTTTITKNEAGRILLTSNKIELSSESQTLAEGEKQGGDIQLAANEIDVQENATVSVNATDNGDAGSINITANNILDLAGQISANGASAGSGGQITTAAPSINLGYNLNVEAKAGEVSDNARGTWQIETAALTIDQASANQISETLRDTNVTVTTTVAMQQDNVAQDIKLLDGVNLINTSSQVSQLQFIALNALNLNGSISDTQQQLIFNATGFNALSQATHAEITANQVSFRSDNIVTLNGVTSATGNESSEPNIDINSEVIQIAGTLQTSNSNNPGRIQLIANDQLILTSSANIKTNGNTGGVVSMTADVMDIHGYIQANGGAGRGGTVNITSNQVIDLNQTWIQTNGFDGGSINIIANTDSIVADLSRIQTNGSNGRGGTITLKANQGTLSYQGIIEANGYTQAGNITLTANHIQILDGSHIAATGHLGGGHIQIGGSWQNNNPNIHQAITNNIEHNVVIDASALTNGNGGEIVIWSDILDADAYTKVYGSVYAKGGSLKGNGGRIETSGPWLYIDGIDVSTHAVNGNDGDWLIDPDYNWGAINAERAATIVSGLQSSNVLIYTQGDTDITISYAINSTSANTLTFQAGDDGNENANILINADVRVGKLVFLAADNIYITSSAVTLTTNNSGDSGALIMSANYTNSGNGAYEITKKLTVRTDGGNVYIGGGNLLGTDLPNATDWDGADFRGGLDIATNGGNVQIRGESNNANGVYFATSNSIVTDGGNILIYGETNATAADGIYFNSNTTLNSGTGTISIFGKNTQTTASSSGGVVFSSHSHSITSASTYHKAISLNGDGGRKSILLNNVSLNATGTGGGIELLTHTTTTYGILMYGDIEILATSGYIRLFTAGAFSTDFYMNPSSVFLGSKASSVVTSSSSNITIRANLFNFSGFNPAIATSGTFTLKPVSTSTSFGQNVSTSWWSWNQNSQTLSGLTFGKSGNTRNITHEINAITVNGPVNFYGSNIYNNAALTVAGDLNFIASSYIEASANFLKTSGSDATLTLKSQGKVNIGGATISSTSNKLNVIIWVESDGGGSYGAETGTISTNGGHLWIGGGSGSSTWNGLTVGNGLSMSDGTSNWNALDLGQSITTSGGDIYMAADRGNSAYNPSIGGLNSVTINSGSGDIAFIIRDPGDFSYNSNTITLISTGILTFAPPTGENWDTNFIWDGSGTTNLTGADSLAGLIINNQSSLGGLVIGQYLGTGVVGDTTYSASNTRNITFDEDASIAGSINLLGTSIALNNNLTSASGSSVIKGQLTGSGNYTQTLGALEIYATGNSTYSGALGGAGTLTKTGSGTLTLGGSSTYTGLTTISAGGLTVTGQLGSGNYSANIVNSAAFSFSSNLNQIISGVISGAGSFTKSGTGILTLSGSNTFTNSLTISSGTINLANANAITSASSLTINGILNLNGYNLTVSSLAGSGQIVNYGGYDLFSGDNASLANGLILYLDPGNPLSYSGSGTSWTDLSSAGSNVTITGSPTYDSSTGTFRFTDGKYAYVSSNQSKFDDLTSGFTVFSIYNFGTAQRWERIIDFGSGSPNANILFARWETGNDLAMQVYNTSTGSTLTASGAISDGWASYAATINGSNSGVLYKDGSSLTSGTLTTPSNADRNNLLIGESNWAAGDYQDTNMRLMLIYNRALTADEINSLHTATTSRSDATLTINNSSAMTFGGSINDNISILNLTKTNTGALTLSGSSNYSGVTTISAGSIYATHGSALGSYGSGQGTTVSDGAMLKISGGVTVAEPITINGTGISSNGAIYFESGNNTYSGAITLGSNSTITTAAGNQTISGAIDGGYSLSITDAGGHWYQRGVIGGSSALTSLTMNGGIVDMNAAISTSGAINVLASDYIYIEGNITITGANQNLYLKAVDEINQLGSSTIQTNGGSVVFWANSDGDSEEWDLIRIGAINTNGGHVWAGGSLYNTGTRIWNGLTVGAGYAYSSLHDAVALRASIDTRTTADSSIGGDVWLAGESGTATSADVGSEGAVRKIQTGNGDIALITHSYRHYNTNNYQTDLYTTGQISIAPISGADWHDTSFTFNYGIAGSWFEGYSNMEQVHIYNFTSIGGLNLGTYNGTGMDGDSAYVEANANGMTISNGITINGQIRVTGDDIYAGNNVDFNTSGASNSDIIFKGRGYVVMETNVDFTTNGGDVILWGNTVNTTSGTANNEVDLRGTNNVSTSGGKIVLAGGLDSNSDGIPDGYSYRSNDDTIRAADLGASVSLNSDGGDIIIRGQGGGVGVGITGSGVTISSGGGDIEIAGISASSIGVWSSYGVTASSSGGDITITGTSNGANKGIYFSGNTLIQSAAGQISLTGTSSSSYGIEVGDNFVLDSSSTADTAINIQGTSTSSHAIYFGSSTANKNFLIQSSSTTSDTGDIVISGTGNDIGVGLDFWGSGSKMQVLTASGDISIIGLGNEGRAVYTSTDLYLGQRANTNTVLGVTPLSSLSTGNINVLSQGGIYQNTGSTGHWTIKTGDTNNAGGDVIIAADTNATDGGYMYFTSGLSIYSFGGDITFGGGDTSASGYAVGTTYNSSFSGNGIYLGGAATINSAGGNTDTGGDISIRGKGYASTWGAYDLNGIYKYAGSTNINSGTGKINISGIAPTQQTNANSVGFWITGGSNHFFTSASPTSDAITITGDASLSASGAAEGILIGAASGRHEFVATGSGGGVIITSKAGTNDIEAMQINDPVYVLANGGDIVLQVESGSTAARIYTDGGGTLFFGATAASNTSYDVTSTTSDIYFRSSGSIIYSALVTAKTNGSNFVIASDTNNSGSGLINIRGGLDVETNGGDITLGGGNTSGTSYAIGENNEQWNEGVRIDTKLNLISGGGDILIQGKTSTRSVSTAGYGNAGVGIYYLGSNGTINSGTGTITINGVNQNATSATTYSSGLIFALNSNYTTTIRSANTSNNAIAVNATSTGSSGSVFGMEIETSSPVTFAATGSGGGISINADGKNYDLVTRSNLDILANGGAINLTLADAGVTDWYKSSTAHIGSKASSLVTTSSSNFTLTADHLTWDGGANPYIGTTGSVVWQSVSNSFGYNLDSRWFNWNQNSQTMSSLTIGKTTNTSNVDIYAVTTSGSITVYASTINTNGNLTTTAAAGHIKLLAKDDISVASGITLTTSGSAGDVILAADTDNSSGGAISASGALTISTNGGDIMLGGGDTSASDFTNGEGSNQVGIRITGNVDFDSQGGDIALRGESTAGGNDSAGIVFGSLVDIQSGAGTILIHGINSSSSSDNTNESSAISIVANQNHIIKSLNTTSSAITITADASTSPGGRGLDIQNDIDIIASGVGGGVTINGYNSDARTYAINLGAGSNILANGGDINLNAYPDNEGDYGYLHIPGVTLGSKAGSDVTSSSSNISLTADYFDLDGNDPKINTSGNVTIQSYSDTWTTFGDRGDLVRISDFTFNDNSSGGEVVADLTIGKSTNSQKIIVDQNISVTGNVYLLAPANAASSDITIDSSRSVTTTGDNKVIVIAAGDDFDNNSGSSALVANGTGSRWIVYSADDNTSGNFNSLDSNNTAVFGETYSSLAPASVAAGNRYVFAETATDTVLSFVTQDETITYGDNLDLTDNYVLNYTGGAAALANVHDGSAGGGSGTTTVATAYSSAPTITISAASSSTSTSGNVEAGSYTLTISVSGGTLNAGYSSGSNSNAGTLTVNQKGLTVSGITASNKTYNGNTTATTDVTSAAFTGLVAGDDVSVSATGTFDNKNVGTVKTVTLSSSYSGDDKDNYTFTDQGSTTANITAKSISSLTLAASNKTYDGNTSATVSVDSTDIVSGDTVTFTNSAVFDDRHVDTGKTVTVSSISISGGSDQGNYTLATSSGSTTANVTQLASVSWNGNAGDGLWSSAGNWAGNALPDGSNVAAVVIPADTNVTFDSDDVGTIGSTIANSGTLTFNGSNDFTFAQVISGTGALAKSGSNTLTLSATNTYTGDTTIAAGTLTVSGQLRSGSYSGDIDNSGTFTYSSNSDQILSGVISGTGSLTKSGTSTLTLTGTNTYTGSTKISAGSLKLGNNTTTGTINNSSITNNSEMVLDFSDDITITSNISGTGTLSVTARYVQFYDSGSGSSLSNSSWTNIMSNSTVQEVLYRIAGGLSHGSAHGSPINGLLSGVNNKSYDAVNNTGSFYILYSNPLNTASNYTKRLKIDLQQNGLNVEAKVDSSIYEYVQYAYDSDTYETSARTYNGNMGYATSYNANGYGLRALDKSVKITFGGDVSLSGAISLGATTSELTDGAAVNMARKFSKAMVEIADGGSLTMGSSGISVNNSLTGNAGYLLINHGTLNINLDSNWDYSGVIAGAGEVIKGGTSTLILSATNTHTGDTTINAGTIKLTGNLNSATDLVIASGATLDLQAALTAATLDLDGTISNTAGTSSLVISGASSLGGSVTTTSTQTYTGATTLTGNTTLATSSAQVTFSNTINSEGSETNNLTVTASETEFNGIIGGTRTLGVMDINGTLDLNAAITAATSIDVSGTSNLGANVTTTGTQTYTGAVTLSANTTLTSTTGSISANTIDGGYALNMVTGSALTISNAIGANSALTKVNLSTTIGNLTLGANITVSGTGTDAMIFNAGSDTAAGTTTGGNIIISGSPTLTTGAGARTTFYTGSISGSTGLTSLIGSGTHRFRYNSDESDVNYSAVLSSGQYAIYREQPTLTITADDETVTYGTAPAESVTTTGMQNGDASATVVTTDASISIAGDTSTSGNYTVGDHTITPSAAASTYGYAISYATGTLTVESKALTISGITAGNKEYDGDAVATDPDGVNLIDVSAATFTGLVDGDDVTVAATGTFDNKNVGAGKTVTLVETKGGADVGNYNITDQGTTTANITQKALTISGITAGNKEYDGDAVATDPDGVNLIDVSAATFTGLVDGDDVTVAATGTFDNKNVGAGKTVTLVETKGGADVGNYNITDQGTTTANITQKALTITASDQSKTYGDTLTFVGNEFTTSSMVGSESVASASFTVASSADSTTTANVGTYAITPSAASGASGTNLNNYSITYVDGSLTVGKRTVTATLTGSTTKTYDGTTAATLTSSNYSLSNLVTGESITVSETSATYDNKNAGTGKTVTANLASDEFTAASGTSLSNYTLPTGNVSGAIGEVTKLSLTITAANDAKFVTQSDTANFAGVLYSGFLGGEDASSLITAGELTTGAVERSNSSVETAGSYSGVLEPTSYAATNYDITVVSGDFTIVPAEQLFVEVAPSDTTYGSTVDYSPGLSISYLDSGSNSIVDLTSTSTLSGNTFSVDDGLGTTATFDVVADGGSYSASNNLIVGDYNLTSDNETIVGSNFNSLLVSGSITITPKAITVTADDQSKTYGDANPSLTYSVTSGSLVSGDSLTGVLATLATTTSNVADYDITQGTLTNSSNSNYSITYVDGMLTVNQKALTITADAQSKTYGETFTFDGDEFTTSTMVGSESIASASFSVASSADSTTTANVGTYTITPSAAVATSGTDLDNYSITYATSDLTVGKATLTVTADDQSKTYGDSNPSFTATYSGFKNSETSTVLSGSPSLTTVATTASDVGDYTITSATGTLTATNYNFTHVDGTLTITPKAITVNAADKSKTYGDANPTLTYSVTSGALVGSDTLTGSITTAATTASNVGDYDITQGTLTNANNSNYSITYVNGTLTVNQRTLNVALGTITKTYDGNTTATITESDYTITNTANSDSFSITQTLGTYDDEDVNDVSSVTVSLSSSHFSATSGSVSNYTLPTSISGTGVITAKALTVTANDASKTYGQTVTLTGSEFTSSGLENSETIGSVSLASSGAAATANVNTYDITPSSATGGTFDINNYSVTYATGTLTVNPATLTVTADDQSKTYGDANPSLTATYTGFQNSDTSSVITGSPSLSTLAATTSAVGDYTITAGAGDLSASNYTFSYVNGTLTINQKAITLTADAQSKTYGETFTFDGDEFTTSTMVGSESIASASFSVASSADSTTTANVGTYTITPSAAVATSGTDLDNYIITYATSDLTVGKRTLSLALTGATTKTYDGNTSATLTSSNYSLSNLVSGESITISETAATYDNKNAGTGKTVSVSLASDDFTAASGTSLSNYTLPTGTTSGAIGEVTKADLSLTGTMTYDGTTTFAASDVTSVTGVNSETFSVTGSATLTSKNVQTSQNLADLGTFTLTGNSGALTTNYNDLSVTDTSVSVTAKAVTLTPTAISKTYDGAFTYTATADDLSDLTNLLESGDTITTATIQFRSSGSNTKNANADTSGNLLSGATLKYVDIASGSVTIDDGNSGNNYSVTLSGAQVGKILQAPLTITAVNDAKFVTQSDTANFAGVIYNGFVSGESAAAQITAGEFSAGVVTRSNAATNTAGAYTDVLVPSGYSADNYAITYNNADFTIIPADQLYVVLSPSDTTYSNNPDYSTSLSARYLDSSSNSIVDLSGNAIVTGSSIVIDDGLGTTATFTATPFNGSNSTSSNLNVGGYNLTATGASITGSNFNSLLVNGVLNITRQSIDPTDSNQLSISSIEKTYDGTATLSGVSVTYNSSSTAIVAGDVLTISGSGSYANRHVGTGKSYTINLSLSGTDSNNYQLSSTSVSKSNGVINQLATVTWTGSAGDNLWSNRLNWANGALPDQSNVATVILGANDTVTYDYDAVGQIGSTVINNGSLSVSGVNNFEFTNAFRGAGTIELDSDGTGTITLSGNSSLLTGNVDINANSIIMNQANALGTGTLVSNGGTVSVASGVTLNQLTTSGTLNISSDINTAGAMVFGDDIVITGGNAVGGVVTPLELNTTNSDMTFNGTITAGSNSKTNKRSLEINVGTGTVIFNDRVGYVFNEVNYINLTDTNLYSFEVTANEIQIKADVMTFEEQTYNGAVLIGDNGNNGLTRTLLSMDPAVTFNGTVDDLVANTHTLIVRAIALDRTPPSITFNDEVNSIKSLVEYRAITGQQDVNDFFGIALSSGATLGTITLADGTVAAGLFRRITQLPSTNTAIDAGRIQNFYNQIFRNFVQNYIQNLLQAVQKPTVNVGVRINESGFDPALKRNDISNDSSGSDGAAPEQACDIAIEEECKI